MPLQPRPERSRHKPVVLTRNLLGLVLSLGLGLGHWHGALAQGFDLDGLRWERRPLLVFAPSAEAPLALALRDALGRADVGLFDRDMIVIEVYGDDSARADGASLPSGYGCPPAPTLRRWRRRRSLSSSWVRTAGRSSGPTSPDLDAIFSLIDTMPMRRREMNNR